MNPHSTPTVRTLGFNDVNCLVPWTNLSFEQKIISILRFNKVDARILREIRQGGGPSMFDSNWWQQHIFPLLPQSEVSEITELLAKKRAFDGAISESPQFVAQAQHAMEAAVQKVFERDWNDAAMLLAACAISPPRRTGSSSQASQSALLFHGNS